MPREPVGSDGIEPLFPAAPDAVRFPLSSQSWRDVVFLHWACDPSAVRPLLPPHTEPDVAEGSAWIGLVGMRFDGVGALGVPFPGREPLHELNVRTYSIDDQGRRGLVFLAMEASWPAFVLAARTLGRLPYCRSAVRARSHDGEIEQGSTRRWPRPAGVGTSWHVRPDGQEIDPTELELFLTARWRMHSRWYGRTLCTTVDHEPWRLRRGELLDFDDAGLVTATGLPRLTGKPHSVLYSPGVDAKFGVPRSLGP